VEVERVAEVEGGRVDADRRADIERRRVAERRLPARHQPVRRVLDADVALRVLVGALSEVLGRAHQEDVVEAEQERGELAALGAVLAGNLELVVVPTRLHVEARVAGEERDEDVDVRAATGDGVAEALVLPDAAGDDGARVEQIGRHLDLVALGEQRLGAHVDDAAGAPPVADAVAAGQVVDGVDEVRAHDAFESAEVVDDRHADTVDVDGRVLGVRAADDQHARPEGRARSAGKRLDHAHRIAERAGHLPHLVDRERAARDVFRLLLVHADDVLVLVREVLDPELERRELCLGDVHLFADRFVAGMHHDDGDLARGHAREREASLSVRGRRHAEPVEGDLERGERSPRPHLEELAVEVGGLGHLGGDRLRLPLEAVLELELHGHGAVRVLGGRELELTRRGDRRLVEAVAGGAEHLDVRDLAGLVDVEEEQDLSFDALRERFVGVRRLDELHELGRLQEWRRLLR
jgi:hypothetical protein